MNQKEEEKIIIQHFRKKWADFPKGRLIPSESPDFILKISPKKSIGIELTGLFSVDDLVVDVRSAINKKEEKLHLYQNMHLSELWLIIHADALDEVRRNPGEKPGNMEISNNFSRVFLFDLFSGKTIILKS